MQESFAVRRLVVGRGAEGGVAIRSDGVPPQTVGSATGFGVSEVLWSPGPLCSVDEGGDPPRDRVGAFPAHGGLAARLIRFPAADDWVRIAGDDPSRPGMHRSETLDLMVVLSGRIVLGVEDGELEVGPYDSVIQRGTEHRWRVAGDEPCTYLSVLLAPSAGAPVRSLPLPSLEPGAGPRLIVTGTGAQGSTVSAVGTVAPDGGGVRRWWDTAGPVRSVSQGGSSADDDPAAGAVSLRTVDLGPGTPAHRTGQGSVELVVVLSGSVTVDPAGGALLSAGDVLVSRDVAVPLASASARLAVVSFVPNGQ